MMHTYGLENSNLFKDIPPSTIEQCLDLIEYEIVSYERGEVIFSPLDRCNKIAFILDGIIEIHRINPSGSDMLLATKYRYDLIGAPSVYSNNKIYASTVIAQKKSQIMLINKHELTRLFTIETKILDSFLQFISDQVIFISQRLDLISLPTLKKKVITYLLSNYHTTNTNEIHLSFSKKKWAEYLNTQPQSLSRTLNELQLDGLIICRTKSITLLDIEKLKNALN